MTWLLVALVAGSTVIADLLQSREMTRHGAIDSFHPGRLGRFFAALARRRYLLLAVFFMAVSFFSFLTLLSMADLSFAVPATAASMVVETALARLYLKERVSPLRWAGATMVACGVVLLAV